MNPNENTSTHDKYAHSQSPGLLTTEVFSTNDCKFEGRQQDCHTTAHYMHANKQKSILTTISKDMCDCLKNSKTFLSVDVKDRCLTNRLSKISFLHIPNLPKYLCEFKHDFNATNMTIQRKQFVTSKKEINNEIGIKNRCWCNETTQNKYKIKNNAQSQNKMINQDLLSGYNRKGKLFNTSSDELVKTLQLTQNNITTIVNECPEISVPLDLSIKSPAIKTNQQDYSECFQKQTSLCSTESTISINTIEQYHLPPPPAHQITRESPYYVQNDHRQLAQHTCSEIQRLNAFLDTLKSSSKLVDKMQYLSEHYNPSNRLFDYSFKNNHLKSNANQVCQSFICSNCGNQTTCRIFDQQENMLYKEIDGYYNSNCKCNQKATLKEITVYPEFKNFSRTNFPETSEGYSEEGKKGCCGCKKKKKDQTDSFHRKESKGCCKKKKIAQNSSLRDQFAENYVLNSGGLDWQPKITFSPKSVHTTPAFKDSVEMEISQKIEILLPVSNKAIQTNDLRQPVNGTRLNSDIVVEQKPIVIGIAELSNIPTNTQCPSTNRAAYQTAVNNLTKECAQVNQYNPQFKKEINPSEPKGRCFSKSNANKNKTYNSVTSTINQPLFDRYNFDEYKTLKQSKPCDQTRTEIEQLHLDQAQTTYVNNNPISYAQDQAQAAYVNTNPISYAQTVPQKNRLGESTSQNPFFTGATATTTCFQSNFRGSAPIGWTLVPLPVFLNCPTQQNQSHTSSDHFIYSSTNLNLRNDFLIIYFAYFMFIIFYF